MLMILARLVRSESFWAVVKVRSPHTGPEVWYPTRMAPRRWEAPRRRGDALLFSRRSSSTAISVVVTSLYAFNINLANSSPRAGQ